MVKVSFFQHKRHTGAVVRELAWPAFVEQHLSSHIHPAGKDGPMFSFAIYDERPQRANDNVIGVSGLVIDFDNSQGKGIDKRPSASPTLPEDTLGNLDGFQCAWYSTYSHTTDWPHWRLVVPLTRALLPHEVGAAFDGLCAMLARDNNIDTTCGELSRAHFLPSCPAEHAGAAFLGAQGGEILNPEYLFSCAEIPPGPATVITPEAFAAKSAGLDRANGRNDALKMIVASMVARGEPLERIISEVHEADQKHNPPLFSDRTEGYRADSWAGAIKFVSNILWTVSSRRASSGLAPELPIIRREAIPAMDLVLTRRSTAGVSIDRQPIPSHLLRPPGAVGMMCDWINASAIKPQPLLSVAASLAACATLVGRKVASPTDLRTNLYMLGIAQSGAGKDHARKCVKAIFERIGGIKHLGGERLASDTGLIDAVVAAKDQSCLFQFDEIGRLLSAIGNAKQSPHLLNIPTVLMEFYSAANSLFLGKQYARQERIDIKQPNVCVYGTTVPGRFFSALSSEEVTDGFLARFMVFESDLDPAEVDVSDDAREPSEILVNTLTERMGWPINASPAGNLDFTNPVPRRLMAQGMADRLFAAFRKDVQAIKGKLASGDDLIAVWNRAQENAWKIATTIGAFDACGDRISTECAEFSIELARVLTQNLCATVTGRVAANRTDAVLKQCERLVSDAGKLGIAHSDLLRSMRCTSRELRPLLDTLAESGRVFAATRKTGQRAATYWIHGSHGGSDEQ